ncbi:MAG TPA: hypothetical protein VGI66_00995 [Streptosporangiaceae bacterium]|jgi:hypothetical protein
MLEKDEEVPFGFSDNGPQPTGTPADWEPGGALGPQVRSNVDAGTDVIDLAAMRESLEAQRKARGPVSDV